MLFVLECKNKKSGNNSERLDDKIIDIFKKLIDYKCITPI